MSARDPHIKLRPATLRGVARREALRGVSLRSSGWRTRASVHVTPPSARVYRVAEDTIIISDGDIGYLPFSLSALEETLRQARDLPVVEGELTLP